MASLVAAPIDRNLGNGMGLVQVGVVDRRYNKQMSGQWGGSYLAEKGEEVSDVEVEDEDEEESADE